MYKRVDPTNDRYRHIMALGHEIQMNNLAVFIQEKIRVKQSRIGR